MQMTGGTRDWKCNKVSLPHLSLSPTQMTQPSLIDLLYLKANPLGTESLPHQE